MAVAWPAGCSLYERRAATGWLGEGGRMGGMVGNGGVMECVTGVCGDNTIW